MTCTEPANKLNFVNHASEAGWRAKRWIKDNPEAWKYATRLALNEAEHQRHFSMRWVVEQVRAKDFTRADGEPFKINNTLAPALARILIKQYPECRPWLELRRAACDGLV